jgi:hypothetical protein
MMCLGNPTGRATGVTKIRDRGNRGKIRGVASASMRHRQSGEREPGTADHHEYPGECQRPQHGEPGIA